MRPVDTQDEQNSDAVEYVTAVVGDQLFGLPISSVQDVFSPDRLTRVPLAPPEVAGVLNLRGRIVTAIDMRVRLGLPPREDRNVRMAVGIDYAGEAYGLLIDSVGEVMKLSTEDREPVPANLDGAWAKMAQGIYRLDGQLLVILDVNEVLAQGREAIAA
jgi:purine-binding chemotaxis protein CheW